MNSKTLLIITIAVFLLSLSLSIYFNPWFNLFSNAYSDLGNPIKTPYYYIFNIGLIATALILFGLILILLNETNDKIEIIGRTILLVSSIFLALIGIFNESTKPHIFISYAFFVIFFVGFLIDNFKSKLRWSIFAFAAIGLLIPFPSIALLETYEIVIVFISMWVLIPNPSSTQ